MGDMIILHLRVKTFKPSNFLHSPSRLHFSKRLEDEQDNGLLLVLPFLFSFYGLLSLFTGIYRSIQVDMTSSIQKLHMAKHLHSRLKSALAVKSCRPDLPYLIAWAGRETEIIGRCDSFTPIRIR